MDCEREEKGGSKHRVKHLVQGQGSTKQVSCPQRSLSINIHLEGRIWSPGGHVEDQGRPRPQPAHTPPPPKVPGVVAWVFCVILQGSRYIYILGSAL